MKKSKSLLLSVLMAGATLLPLSSCGNNDKVIRLQLTASKPGDVLTQSATALEPYLEAEMPGYDFKITVGTDFAADGTGLAAGTIDAAFMTASTFATTEIAEPGKVEMILRSTRAGFKVIEDFADKDGDHTSAEARELQLAAMNGKDGYKYRGEASKDPVSYYYAECIIKKDKVGIAQMAMVDLKEKLRPFVLHDILTDENLSLDEEDFYKLGLVGPGSKEKREKLIAHYHIPFTSAKKVEDCLLMLQINAKEIQEVLS